MPAASWITQQVEHTGQHLEADSVHILSFSQTVEIRLIIFKNFNG